MTKDNWTDRLSEYLDGTLAVGERAALEAHLVDCAACAATLEELRRVVARARALDDRAPGADLWPKIAVGIGRATAPPARRYFAFTVPQLIAASVALIILSGGTTWLLRSRAVTATPVATAPPLAQTDTTIPVRPGARLDVNNFGGSIAVSTWAKSAVRVQAEHSSRDRVQVSGSEAVVSVKSTGRLGPSQVIDYTITVPVSMALALSGVYADITVEGSQGEITAETVQGEVKVTGGSGFVSLRSVNGEVTLEKARGRIALNTVNEGITLRDASGDVAAETVNGDVRLERSESGNVEANTVNGGIVYDGTIKESGRYRFATHDGDLAIAIPENASVAVSVSTFDGDFEACFPVTLTGKTKHRFSFTIGSGSARLELESFNGDIKLCRPGRLKEK